MPGDKLRKRLPGDSPAFPATIYNQLLDLAAGQNFQGGGNVSRAVRQTGIILVRNDSGAAVEQFGILGLDAPLILPVDDGEEFKRQVAFSGVAPLVSAHSGKFAVLVEPLAVGEMGRAVVSGVTHVRLSVDPTNMLGYADVEDGETGALLNSETGSAAVLWVEDDGQAEQWAVVRVGNVAASPVGWVQIGLAGTGWATTSATSNVIASSGSKTFTVDADLFWQAGDRVLITSTGSAATMEGAVTSYSGTSLVMTADTSTGTGTHTDWTLDALTVQGRYPGSLYDNDLVFTIPIWVLDVNGRQPVLAAYYLGLRALSNTGAAFDPVSVGRPVYRVAAGFLIGIECVSGSIVGTYG